MAGDEVPAELMCGPSGSKKRKKDTEDDLRNLLSEQTTLLRDMAEDLRRCRKENKELREQLMRLTCKEDNKNDDDDNDNESSNESSSDEEDDLENEETSMSCDETPQMYTVHFPSLDETVGNKSRRKPAGQDATPAASSRSSRSITNASKSIPVITTYDIDIKLIMRSITNRLGHKHFSMTILGKKVTNISTFTLEDHLKLRTLFEEIKVSFYTHTPKGSKPYTVVVKRLSDIYDEEDVKDYLNGIDIQMTVLGVTKMGGNRWLIKLSKDSDLVGFHSIRSILNCRIRFERFKKNGPTQCFQCQRFGHVAINCNMPSRCVKCAGPHESGECTIPGKDTNTQPISKMDGRTGAVIVQIGQTVRCANCDADGHTAGSRDCPRKMAIIRKMKESRTATRIDGPRNLGASNLRPGMSYANAVGHSTGPTWRTSGRNQTSAAPGFGVAQSNFSLLDSDCQRLFGKNMFSCMDKVGNFADTYRRLQTDADKKQALFGLMVSLQYTP